MNIYVSPLREAAMAVIEAGQMLKANAGRKMDISTGTTADRETPYDVQSLGMIVQALRQSYPDDGIMGEGLTKEGRAQSWGMTINGRGFCFGRSDRVWVIDPICGTTAFHNGNPQWIISLGLVTDTY